MDGKGRAIDNIFIERLWRSVKYDYVYIKVPSDGLELYHGLKEHSILVIIKMSYAIKELIIKFLQIFILTGQHDFPFQIQS